MYVSLFQIKELENLTQTLPIKKSEGPCVKKLDETLNKLNVQRQAYHGKSFVGNHVHKMLKVIYISQISISYVYISPYVYFVNRLHMIKKMPPNCFFIYHSS